MKAIEYINNKQKRAVWLRAFHIWQRRPHELAPLSEESRTCSSCGTVYQGNFCPRCGQSARVGRFSFKKAALLFLDVWGVGNRSMFRSIRDLMLRPGFMIRDYLSGMQSAYFPPFKMFFLLAAFSLVVEHGFNFGLDVKDVQDEAPKTEQTAMENTKIARHDLTVHPGDKEEDIKWKAVGNASLRFVKVMDALSEKNPAVFSLLSLVLFSVPLFFYCGISVHLEYVQHLFHSRKPVGFQYPQNHCGPDDLCCAQAVLGIQQAPRTPLHRLDHPYFNLCNGSHRRRRSEFHLSFCIKKHLDCNFFCFHTTNRL